MITCSCASLEVFKTIMLKDFSMKAELHQFKILATPPRLQPPLTRRAINITS